METNRFPDFQVIKMAGLTIFHNSPNSFSYRGSDGVAKEPWPDDGSALENRGQLLCAGAVLRACHLRHSAAK